MSWLPVLVIGGFWFWTIIILVNIAIVLLEENDHNFWPLALVVLTVIVLQGFSALHPLTALRGVSPWHVLAYIAAYIVCGVLWSFFKWWMFLIEKRDSIIDLAKSAVGARNWQGPELTEKDKAEQRQRRINYLQDHLPTADQNKAKITHWMTFWPWSVLAFVLSDFVQKIARFLYEQMGFIYERIAKHVFASIITEIESHKEQKNAKTS